MAPARVRPTSGSTGPPARFRLAGDDEATAYERSCENVTGPIALTISRAGLRAVREGLDEMGLLARTP
ncbi:hypothetical protein ABZ078_23120 [Streptomyces sp. NPDC006385]|uniref:hypothetical protein n=1 Tax=Streptomyces sp. NPDC006385 TaxID=3156761 RepID=UPI0033B42139